MRDESGHPLDPPNYDGEDVILFLITNLAVGQVFALVAAARSFEGGVRFAPRSGGEEIELRGNQKTLGAFEASLLHRLVEPRSLAGVASLRPGVRLAVAALHETAPPGAIGLRNPFFGLALGPERNVILMLRDEE